LQHFLSVEERLMDWKRLAQFALLGSSDSEQYAILLMRVSIGLFFAISGARKLFLAGSRQTMYETLTRAKVRFPSLMTYFVSSVEFVGGSMLAAGLLSSLASLALSVNMVVAILTAKLSAMPKGLSSLGWVDNLLYIPEVLYVLVFLWMICSGPGKLSVDYWLADQLQK
jgi:putative oxidoreductase